MEDISEPTDLKHEDIQHGQISTELSLKRKFPNLNSIINETKKDNERNIDVYEEKLINEGSVPAISHMKQEIISSGEFKVTDTATVSNIISNESCQYLDFDSVKTEAVQDNEKNIDINEEILFNKEHTFTIPTLKQGNNSLDEHNDVADKDCYSSIILMSAEQHSESVHHSEKMTSGKIHECNFCSKSFRSNYDLTRHLRSHTGEKPYQCMTCQKSFSEQSKLTRHIGVHTGEKPYQCITCNKSFAQKNALNIHMRTHTGNKPYQCTFCNRLFSDNSSYLKHIKLHNDEKQYKCATCSKKYTEKRYLVIHIRTHTGERLYQCSSCEKKFYTNSHLKRHMKIHTHLL